MKVTINFSPLEVAEIISEHVQKKGFAVTDGVEFVVTIQHKDRPGETDRAAFLGINVKALTSDEKPDESL